ncbi:cysteine desulfurase-like protein [Amaricoccus tamworthensis]|uniref:cysteine desulfurase-like protein n=1 Tax=Amaricoccus tamworthensis TaxID=57002 RepID=UPI003C7A3CB7
MGFPVMRVRERFPSLAVRDEGRERVYLDNPAGTQVPQTVVEAIGDYFLNHSSNSGGMFATSQATDRIAETAHEDMALFLGAASAREVVIGQSMTSLTFHLSRSICRDFQPGDEIVITRMEHEGNVGPWLEVAKEKGLRIIWVDFDRETWQVRPEDLAEVLSDRTRLVALNYASNMTGAINDVRALAEAAHEADALVYVDAVQLAPHHLVDVQGLGCDFLACSSYKFFGPHMGIVWGREALLAELHPYKGRCVTDELPGRFEAGTPQYELLAGLSATVAWFEELGRMCGGTGSRRGLIAQAYAAAREHEEAMTLQLIAGLEALDGVMVYGITDPARVGERVPTVSFRHTRVKPLEIATALGGQGIFVWHGHNYAWEPARALELPLDEGVVRIGLAQYNTTGEVTRVVDAVAAAIAGG